jgi:replication factor A1
LLSFLIEASRLTILLDVTPLGEANDKIGEPTSLEGPQNAQTTAQQPQAQPQAAQQQQQAPKNSGLEKAPPIYSITDLSPYNQKFTMKVRVTQKSEVKNWSNQRGEGKLFSVILMDDTGEIKATGFNRAVDELYDKLVEGKVYLISRARVGLAKKRFSHLQNDYEVSFEANTEVIEVSVQ